MRRNTVHEGAVQAGGESTEHGAVQAPGLESVGKKGGEVRKDCECSVLKSVVPTASRESGSSVAA